MAEMRPDEAVAALGIHRDHEELFVALWELLRAPGRREEGVPGPGELVASRQAHDQLDDGGFVVTAVEGRVLAGEWETSIRVTGLPRRALSRREARLLGRSLLLASRTVLGEPPDEVGAEDPKHGVLKAELDEKRAQLAQIDEVLEGRSHRLKGVDGVRDVVEHDRFVSGELRRVNRYLERAGVARRGSTGVYELVREFLEARQKPLEAPVADAEGEEAPECQPGPGSVTETLAWALGRDEEGRWDPQGRRMAQLLAGRGHTSVKALMRLDDGDLLDIFDTEGLSREAMERIHRSVGHCAFWDRWMPRPGAKDGQTSKTL